MNYVYKCKNCPTVKICESPTGKVEYINLSSRRGNFECEHDWDTIEPEWIKELKATLDSLKKVLMTEVLKIKEFFARKKFWLSK